jgi:hypothetical protein
LLAPQSEVNIPVSTLVIISVQHVSTHATKMANQNV